MATREPASTDEEATEAAWATMAALGSPVAIERGWLFATMTAPSRSAIRPDHVVGEARLTYLNPFLPEVGERSRPQRGY